MPNSPTSRDQTIFIALVLGTPAVMIAVAVRLAPSNQITAAIGALVLGLIIGSLIAFTVTEQTREEAAQAQARNDQADIENKIGEEGASTVDIALLNMGKLNEYYNLNKQQARRSFNSSIVAVVVGFATILLSVLFVKDSNAKFASALGGLLGQFIGACFFYLYNKSLNQLNLFYGKLISLQNTMLALQICEKLDTEKEGTLKTIALELMSRKETSISDSGAIVSKQPRPRTVHSKTREKAQKATETFAGREGAGQVA